MIERAEQVEPVIEAQQLAAMRRALLSWYLEHRRDLPWRAEPGAMNDPYAVLVSEAMLQQTQVATVVGYYGRFMAALPRVEDLAGASEQRVLALWQGLGYYRRAKHLHAAAKAIVERHGGAFPDSADGLRELPGVGAYTAGAVASIAMGQAEPIVDGNVVRVMARLMRIGGAVEDAGVKRRVWSAAGAWVSGGRWRVKGRTLHAGDLNQAMMELGATVCTPRGPECGACPLGRWCGAKREGAVERYPAARKRKEPRAVVHVTVAVRRGDRVLLRRRGERGLWAGMWEMPTWEGPTDRAERTVREWAERETGLRIGVMRKIGEMEHVTTHRRVRFELWTAEASGRAAGRGEWRTTDGAGDLPLSAAQRKLLARVREARPFI